MLYIDPSKSRKFFKSQWGNPFRRFRKAVLPILVSGMGAFLIIVGLFSLFPSIGNEGGGSYSIILHTVFAVILGVTIAFLGHLWQLRSLSQFQTIKIRVRNRK